VSVSLLGAGLAVKALDGRTTGFGPAFKAQIGGLLRPRVGFLCKTAAQRVAAGRRSSDELTSPRLQG